MDPSIHHQASFKEKLYQQLFRPVDASSLIVFRVGFGLIMLWEVIRYWSSDWIARYFIVPEFYFKYYGFGWVQPWDGNGMYLHFIALGILAIFISIGFLYRTSSIIFTLAFSYIFLLDQARYLNHFYLVILFSAILIMVPAHRKFSVDARIRPRQRSDTVPAWSIWLLRIQMEIILIYAGLVKINSDWLQLEPLSMWLAKRSDLPIFGHLFTQEWAVAVAAYGVIILHIVGAPLLLWKKARIYVFFIYFAFHTLNHFVFSIGIFPWFTLFATLLFFDPDWPKQCLAFLRGIATNNDTKLTDTVVPSQSTFPTSSASARVWIASLLGIWVTIQVLIPLRHWLYPGNVSWTEQGHLFSWQMKLRAKKGLTQFYVTDPSTNKTTTLYPQDFLTRRQVRKMSTRPDMILQFAHFLRDDWAVKNNISNPVITVDSIASLNGRDAARLIDKQRNLAKVERSILPADWILPLTLPLKINTSD